MSYLTRELKKPKFFKGKTLKKQKIQAAIFQERKVSKFIEFSRSWQLWEEMGKRRKRRIWKFFGKMLLHQFVDLHKTRCWQFNFKLLRKFTCNRNFTALCLLEPVIVPDSTAKAIFVFILVRWHNFGLAGSQFPTTPNQRRKLGLNPGQVTTRIDHF